MALFVDTTGTDIDLFDLGIRLEHPTVDFDLATKFDARDLAKSDFLTNAITSGLLAWKKTSGGAVELPVDYDPEYLVSVEANLGTGDQDDRLVSFKDLTTAIGDSASPGFTWGQSGSAGSGQYLLNEDVESNKAGRLVPFSGFVTKFFFNNEKISGNKRLLLRRRRPCQTGGFTTIAEVVAPPGDPCGLFTPPSPVEVLSGDELAVQVAGNSADVENVIVGVILNTSQGSGGGGSSPGGGSGETNTGSNLGSGAEVFSGKVGVDFQFRTLVSDFGNDVIQGADEINIRRVLTLCVLAETTGGQNVTSGWTPITLNSDERVDTGFTRPSTSVVQVDTTGWYEISYAISTEIPSGNSRSQSAARLTRNTAPISGTFQFIYNRNSAQGGGNASCTKRVLLTAGDQIRLEAQRVAGGAQILVAPNSVTLELEYLGP